MSFEIIINAGNSIEVDVNSGQLQTNILGIKGDAGTDGATAFTGLTDTPANYSGEATKHLVVNAGETAVEFVTAPSASTDFVSLTDTPANYSGEANKLLSVNAGETAVEFITPPTSTTLVGLTDTPANYSGSGSKILAVNSGATAVEFITLPDSGQLFNWVMNPDFTINQRTGTKTPGIGVYGFDRWKGHASGLEQVVEGLPAGEYTLTWTGGGSGTFGGTTSGSPFVVTVSAGNTSVIIPATATLVSLVAGNQITSDPFIARIIGDELGMCQRYFWAGKSMVDLAYFSSTALGAGYYGGGVTFPVRMRIAPTVTISGAVYFACTNLSIVASVDSIVHTVSTTGSGAYRVSGTVYSANSDF